MPETAWQWHTPAPRTMRLGLACGWANHLAGRGGGAWQVMEAKARKKIKMVRAAQKASNKADQISNDSDLSDKVCSACVWRGCVRGDAQMRRCV